jgi:hypothetical protein
MHVWRVVLRIARRPTLGDRVAFAHVRAAPHGDQADVRQGGLDAVGGRDRDREAVGRHLAGEGHLAGDGRSHGARASERDVDSAMLPRGVLVAAERELSKDRPLGRP